MLCSGVDATRGSRAFGNEVERQHPGRHGALEGSEALVSSMLEEIQDAPNRKVTGIDRFAAIEGLFLEELDVLPAALAEIPVTGESRAARRLSHVGPFPTPEAAARLEGSTMLEP